MESVHIGVVGCGLFGACHLQVFQKLRTATVEAVFDTDRRRAEEMAGKYGIPRVCSDLEEICALPGVHAIDVLTPEAEHLRPVLTALAAGKHVFVEKPMATDPASCSQMIEAAARAECLLAVGHLLRFETKYLLLKEEIQSGNLGRLVSMHARRNRPKSLLPRYGRTHPALENCIHDIDLMLWYTGKPAVRVRGFGRKAINTRHPDTFWGVLEFEGGAIGVVETIWLLPDAAGVMLDDAFQAVGEAGVGNVRLVPEAVSLWSDSGYRAPDFSYGPEVRGAIGGALREELASFCECILDGGPPSGASPAEAREAVRVTHALIQSALSEQDVELPIE